MSANRVVSELTVAILPLGLISARQIDLTEKILKCEFGVKTIRLPKTEVPRLYFNAKHNRYRAPQIVNFLFFQLPANAQRIVGIMADGMEYNDTSPCSGYADFYIGTAVYSVPPLPKRHPNPEDNRIDKDCRSYCLIAHEFGHTLSLQHCEDTTCVMHKDSSKLIMCENCQRWANRELLVKPGSAEERFALAENLQSFKLTSRALEVYQQAVDQAHREPHYYHRLARALAESGQAQEAKNAMVYAAAFARDYPEFNYVSALNCLETDPDETEKLFARAIETAKDKARVHQIIGNAYREIAHNVDKALQHYREYFQLGGNDQTIVDWYNSRLRGEVKS